MLETLHALSSIPSMIYNWKDKNWTQWRFKSLKIARQDGSAGNPSTLETKTGGLQRVWGGSEPQSESQVFLGFSVKLVSKVNKQVLKANPTILVALIWGLERNKIIYVYTWKSFKLV